MGRLRDDILVYVHRYEAEMADKELPIANSPTVTRRVVVRAWGGDEQMTPTRKVAASTIASLPAGALMGLATKSEITLLALLSYWLWH
jgi:hypothetical protein